ncbi:MAG TPA: hypothetical protein GX012_02785 [Acholeplasma sp.]|nr:hypothetical protein [Acholeplasma sp.]
MDLIKKINDKGLDKVNFIIEEAKKEAEALKQSLIDEALEESRIKVNNIKKEVESEITTKERLLTFEQRQAELLAKQNIIDNIFDEVRVKIEALEGAELLNYVYVKIKQEKLNGDEIMHTNKENYERYFKALSSGTKGDLVDLDKLNKKLKTTFKLSNRPVDISNGFILEGKHFDLNFSIEEVIEKLKNKHERALVKELFE